MYQRASQGGGSVSPTVTSKALAVGGSVSFDAPQNGVYWFERTGTEYQNYACGYFINGVHTNRVTRSPATVSVSGGRLTVGMGSGGQAGTVYLYTVN